MPYFIFCERMPHFYFLRRVIYSITQAGYQSRRNTLSRAWNGCPLRRVCYRDSSIYSPRYADRGGVPFFVSIQVCWTCQVEKSSESVGVGRLFCVRLGRDTLRSFRQTLQVRLAMSFVGLKIWFLPYIIRCLLEPVVGICLRYSCLVLVRSAF